MAELEPRKHWKFGYRPRPSGVEFRILRLPSPSVGNFGVGRLGLRDQAAPGVLASQADIA
jgi:hypothetical protein